MDTRTETTKHQPHCRAPQGFVCCCVDNSMITEDWLGGLDGESMREHLHKEAMAKVDADGDSDEN